MCMYMFGYMLRNMYMCDMYNMYNMYMYMYMLYMYMYMLLSDML